MLTQASCYKQINRSEWFCPDILMAESEGEGICVDEKGVFLPSWFYLSSKHGSRTHDFEPSAT